MDLFLGVLLATAGWALAAIVAELEYTRLMQHLGAGLATYFGSGFLCGWLLGPFIQGFEPEWLGWLIFYTALGVCAFLVAQLLSRLAYVVGYSEANRMSLTVAICMVLSELFLRWALHS